MSNRITWQQVSGPDFQSSAYLQAKASDSFAKAMEGLGDVFGEAGEKKKAAADLRTDAKVADYLLRHRSTGTLDQALATQGIGAAGLTREEVTEDALDKLYGYRSSLETSRANDTTDATNRFNLGKDEYNFGRSREADAKSDEAAAMAEHAFAEANKLADDRNLLTREDAAEYIIKQKLDPKFEVAMLDALGKVDSKNWDVGDVDLSEHELVKAAPQDIESVLLSKTESLDNQERALADERGKNRGLQYYETGVARYGDTMDPMSAVIKNLGADETSDEEGVFSRSRGEMRGLFNDMTSKFPGVHPNIVAAVIQDNLDPTGLSVFMNDGQVPAVAKIKEILGGLDDPTDSMRLNDQINKYKREDTRIKNERAELTKLDNTLRAQIYRGSSQEAIQKTINGILELSGYANLSPEEKAAAAQTIVDAAVAGSAGKDVLGQPATGTTPATPPKLQAPDMTTAAEQAFASANRNMTDGPVNPNIDPTIAANHAAVTSGAGAVGGTLDHAGNWVATSLPWLGGQVQKGLGHAIGATVSPEVGTSLLQVGRDNVARANREHEGGYLPEAAPSPVGQALPPGLSNPLLPAELQEMTSGFPKDELTILGADSGETIGDPDQLAQALRYLSGESDHPVDRRAALQRAVTFIQRMNQKGGPKTDAERKMVRKAEKLLQDM